jgi:hypothetical membrane protein
MQKHLPLSFIASILASLCYVSFTLLAFLQFPGVYSPLGNWLSDLGNPDGNPAGAYFYNIGIISTGVLLAAFFLGLSRWKMEKPRMQAAMLFTTRLFGYLGSLAMIMSAVFPINRIEQHRFWSIALFILLGTAFVFSIFALRYHPGCPRWVLLAGAATGSVDILSGVFHDATLLEWITVSFVLGYVLIIGIATRALQAEMGGRVERRAAASS